MKFAYVGKIRGLLAMLQLMCSEEGDKPLKEIIARAKEEEADWKLTGVTS